MNHKPNEQLDELLDRATTALHGTEPSDAPPPELVESTIERVRLVDFPTTSTSVEPDSVRLAERRQLMFRVLRYSSAVAAVIVVAVFGWLFFADQSTAAFAGVIESVKQAESVTLTNKQKIGNQPEMELKWYIQDEKVRMEFPGAVAFVTNLAEKTTYELNLRNKTARALPLPEDGRQAFANPVTHLQNAKPNDAKLIGEEQLHGKAVQLYTLDKVDFLGAKGAGTMKVWVDPNTNLPVKILMDQPQKQAGSRNTIELSDFQWNIELSESLFQVPADYTIKARQ